MILEYLKVLLTWPVIGGGLIGTFIVLFRTPIQRLIDRIGRIRFPGGEFSTSQQEKIEEAGAQTGTGPVTAPVSTAPQLEGMHLSQKDIEELRAYFEAERAAARIWEYRYLNYFFAQGTQYVLDWVIALNKSTTISAFEAVWMLTIQNAQERQAILHALQLHVLILINDQTITLTDKGREYAAWPERRHLRTA